MTGKDGYFKAKRQMQESFGYRISKLEEELKKAEADGDVHRHIAIKSKITQLEEVLSYVRNVMLWDTRWDQE